MSDTSISPDAYRRAPDVIEADVGGEVVLLHTQNWQYYEFDKVGTAIWGLLDEPRTLSGLVDALMERYEVDRDRCSQDTGAFIEEMVAQGLIVAG